VVAHEGHESHGAALQVDDAGLVPVHFQERLLPTQRGAMELERAGPKIRINVADDVPVQGVCVRHLCN
jgi:hypothetical protein